MTDSTMAILQEASRQVGIATTGARLIRAAENTLYLLPGHIVARVTRPGQLPAATKELAVSRWLRAAGVAVVEALPGIDHPVALHDRAVTFWVELSPHTRGTPRDVALILRQLHALPLPSDLVLPPLAPFVRLAERIGASPLAAPERTWLISHLANLERRFESVTLAPPQVAIHGDAWSGNIAVTTAGPVLLDLERFAVGPREWDLVSTAVDHQTFGTISVEDWADYCATYGYDVTEWEHFELFRDVRELRKVTFAIQMATELPYLMDRAQYRIECIQGRHGSRPWGWKGVP